MGREGVKGRERGEERGGRGSRSSMPTKKVVKRTGYEIWNVRGNMEGVGGGEKG